MKLNLHRILLIMLLGVVLYGGFVVYAGFQTMAESLSGFAWWTFAGAIALASTNFALRFCKWQYYLQILGIKGVPAKESALIFMSGFVLTVTPGKVGEVFKSAVMSRTHGVPAERTSPIVIAERLTDVIGVIALIVIGSISFDGGWFWAVAGSAAVLIGFVGIFWQLPALWLIARTERSFMSRWAPRLRTAYAELRALASPRALLIPVLLSVVGWGCEGMALNLLLHGFAQQPELTQSVFFYATATLAGALIPVPGGLGVTETLMQEQLVRVAAVTQGAATSSMLLVRFATLWWAVVVGFGALGLLKRRFPTLLRDKAAAATAEAETVTS
jgi:uncharacterized protein (TIRG00374 family)